MLESRVASGHPMTTDRPTSPKKPQHLERLLEVSRTLSSTLDLPQLLQSIVDIAPDLTQSEAASILLHIVLIKSPVLTISLAIDPYHASSQLTRLESSIAG